MSTITGTSTGTLAPVSAIADVLALWGLDGWLTPPLSPIVAAAQPLVGRALTVQIEVGPTGPGLRSIYDVLSDDLTGRVLVIAGAEPVAGAVWGEILTLAARQQHASAVLVEGWVRDRPEMASLGIAVYAGGECVAGPQGRAHIVGIDVDVTVHGVAIAADDHIVADATGCIRVPAGRLDDVLDAAQRYAAAEVHVARALAEGETLATAYRHKQSIVDELRR